jgi:excisionase family DNA binding protein
MTTKKNAEITAIDAARRLGVGLDYLYGLLWTGRLSGRKVSGRWRVPLSAIEERLAALRVRNG